MIEKLRLTDNKLTDNALKWFKNKLSGNFAENICSVHFQSLNYSVEKTGIENIAPFYAKNLNFFQNNFVKNHLNKTPDFIVSKNQEDAIFVEVKFNSNLSDSSESFYKFGQDLILTYKHIIFKSKYLESIANQSFKDLELYDYINNQSENIFKDDVKVYFYVVVPHTKYFNSYVFLFMPNLITKNNFGWRSVANPKIDEQSGIKNFNENYKLLIEPFLNNIFNNQLS